MLDDLPPSLSAQRDAEDLPPSLSGGGEDLPPSLSGDSGGSFVDTVESATREITRPLTEPFEQARTPVEQVIAPVRGAAAFAARPLFQQLPGTRKYAGEVNEFYQPQAELDAAAERAGSEPGGMTARNFPYKPFLKRVGAEVLSSQIPQRPIDAAGLLMPWVLKEKPPFPGYYDTTGVPYISPDQPPPTGLPAPRTGPGLPPGRVEGPGFTMADEPNMAAGVESEAYNPRTARSVIRRRYQTGEIPPIQPADLPPSLASGERLALPPGYTEGDGFRMMDQPDDAAMQNQPPARTPQRMLPAPRTTAGDGFEMADSPDLARAPQRKLFSPKRGDIEVNRFEQQGDVQPLSMTRRVKPPKPQKIERIIEIPQQRDLPPSLQGQAGSPTAQAGMPRESNFSGDANGASNMISPISAPPRTQDLSLGDQVSANAVAPSATMRPMQSPEMTTGPSTTLSPDLGTIEPTSTKRITQASTDVKAIAQQAAEKKPSFDSILKDVSDNVEGSQFRGSRVKNLARVSQKADTRPPNVISDYLGGRITVDTEAAADQVVQKLSEHGRIIDDDGSFAKRPGGYMGRHVQVDLGDGFSAEVQIVPHEIADAHTAAHEQYRIMRNVEVPEAERLAAKAKSIDIMEAARKQYEERLATGGKGAAKIERLFPEKPSGEEGFVKLGAEAPKPDVYGREYTKWDEAQRALIDRFQPIKYKPGAEIAPEFESAGGKYTESYVSASTFTGKARGAWETAFQDRNQILKPLKNGADREVFNRVAWMKHFMDLDRLGKTTSGVTAEAAQAEMLRLRSAIGAERFDRIAKVANDFTKWYSQARLKMMVEGKLITPETAEALRTRYPNYIPTEVLDGEMKKVDPVYEPVQPLGRVKAGFLKTKKGTTADVNTDVLDVTSRGYAQVAMAAEKQKVIDKIADEFGTQIGSRSFQDGQMVTRVNPKNIPPGWIRSNVKVSDGRVIAVSPQVDRLLRGLDVESMDMVTTAMSKYNAIFRHSATAWRTAFGLGHVVRAFESALINRRPIAGEAAFIPSILKGISSAVKESLGIPDELYREWITGGGGFGGLASSVKASSTQRIPFRLLSGHEQLARVAEAPLEALGRLTRASDNVIRLAEYARLKPTQLPNALKILQSRRVPIDFEKYGDAMRVMNRWVPFVNDKVQSDVNALQVAQHHPMLTLGRLGAYAAAPAVSLYAWNHRDKATKDLDALVPERFKEQNFYVHTGMKTSDGNPIVIAVPKKGPIAMVSNMVEGLLEKAHKDPAFEQRLKDYTAASETQKLASMLLPPAFRAPMEQAFNIDMFSGRPIVNERLKDVAPRYQFNPGTSNTARYIGQKTGMSPVRLEAGARSIFPASGQILQGASPLFKNKVPIPRAERDTVYGAQAFEPFVKVPAQHYSVAEEQARDFEQQGRESGRTPAFMLNQAYSQYLRDRTPANLRVLQDWAAKTPAQERVRAMQKARRDYVNEQLSPSERARRQVPLQRRGRFSAETGVGMP